ALERVVAESRMSSETRMVEDFLAELGKESGFVTYGTAHVKKAVDAGAVNSVIVSDKLVREKDAQKILASAEAMKAEVAIISSTHEAGEKLLALGGIAAFLRYKFEEQ
ncbi:MAG: mRNA surveillance protein Pelota, partial [Candidatus Aenigmarchaeota archaeon]|nr:mRNA surveillance protein Pelota [Candidatus Aenigmarchaeota archaeon]